MKWTDHRMALLPTPGAPVTQKTLEPAGLASHESTSVNTHWRPALPMLVLSMHPERQYAVRAFRSGAAGYLTKANASAELTHYAISNDLVE